LNGEGAEKNHKYKKERRPNWSAVPSLNPKRKMLNGETGGFRVETLSVPAVISQRPQRLKQFPQFDRY
jgi:hypothetical protein